MIEPTHLEAVEAVLVEAVACHLCDDAAQLLASAEREGKLRVRRIALESEEGKAIARATRAPMPPIVLINGEFFMQMAKLEADGGLERAGVTIVPVVMNSFQPGRGRTAALRHPHALSRRSQRICVKPLQDAWYGAPRQPSRPQLHPRGIRRYHEVARRLSGHVGRSGRVDLCGPSPAPLIAHHHARCGRRLIHCRTELASRDRAGLPSPR